MPRSEVRSLLVLGSLVLLSTFAASSLKPLGRAAFTAHRTADIIDLPTSVQWRHPYGSFPEATLIKGVNDRGKMEWRTVPLSLGLPMVSITLPKGALFDPDTGIYVVGNAIWHTHAEAVRRYPDDQKWWKYPGNYSFRGKAWERSAHLEYFDTAGNEAYASDVRLRINGNNTRGFPQHALRVMLPSPSTFAFFGSERGIGHHRILLRSSGNDQDRTFFRDQYQHALCEGLPFETVAGDQCVVFINGAYWGLHNLRERMDERELARRYHLKPGKIAIIADRLDLYRGDSSELKRFSRLLTKSDKWDEAALADSLDRYVDLNGFLNYMAAQIILGNIDWPDQNGKWWRYTGSPDTTRTHRDGRWYWIMGDSDQGVGIASGPEYDMFLHVGQRRTPLARLYINCMRSAKLRLRFRSIVLHLLEGPLSRERMVRMAQEQHDLIAREMPRHIRRWRRPLTMEAWEANVRTLLNFAEKRGDLVRVQLDEHFPAEPLN